MKIQTHQFTLLKINCKPDPNRKTVAQTQLAVSVNPTVNPLQMDCADLASAKIREIKGSTPSPRLNSCLIN